MALAAALVRQTCVTYFFILHNCVGLFLLFFGLLNGPFFVSLPSMTIAEFSTSALAHIVTGNPSRRNAAPRAHWDGGPSDNHDVGLARRLLSPPAHLLLRPNQALATLVNHHSYGPRCRSQHRLHGSSRELRLPSNDRPLGDVLLHHDCLL